MRKPSLFAWGLAFATATTFACGTSGRGDELDRPLPSGASGDSGRSQSDAPVDDSVPVNLSGDDAGSDASPTFPSCLAVKQAIPAAPSGVYIVTPSNVAPFQAYCDMTTAGGGWTLVANRRASANNIEACGTNLRTFFANGCGTVSSITGNDSYALASAQRLSLGFTELAIIQYLAGVPDLDDAFIVKFAAGADPFPNTVALQDIPVVRACNIDNTNCDVASVVWRWVGDAWFHNSSCTAAPVNMTVYHGNYGLCDNGTSTANNTGYSSNRLFGNRAAYDETKLWGYDGEGVLSANGRLYQERVFVR